MLDITYIRENTEVVRKASQDKNVDVDLQLLLDLDQKRRDLQQRVEGLRQQRNELAQTIKQAKPTSSQIERGKTLKAEISQLESELSSLDQQYLPLLKQVPNIPLADVPIGTSEDDNQVVEEVGERTQFDFQPRNHWEIARDLDWIDKERAAKVAGSRFVYLKGDLVKLQFAIINYAMDRLTDGNWIQQVIDTHKLDLPAKPFIPLLPPLMLRTEVFDAMDRLEPQDERYRVGEESDGLWLQGSAEHTIGSMYMNEIIDASELPIRYIGYATSFRREAGSYGKDMEGLIRLHQFDKLEMEVFSSSDSGLAEHELMIGIQRRLMEELELPYRVINKCTADIGKPNVRGWDIEAWLPGQGKYRETHTADYMGEYQARRLNARYRTSEGQTELLHTNDATALALSRIPVAIIENYQTKAGRVRVPAVLQPYLNKEEIK